MNLDLDQREGAFRDFFERRLSGDANSVTGIYHAVRNIPYGSTGERDPLRVLKNNLGSCSGKHILLRDLLRCAGYKAEVVTIFTYFNHGIPLHATMPATLQCLLRGEPIIDFHHYVRLQTNSSWLKLDATWHDVLVEFGFPVNSGWSGQGDTVLAATPIKEYPAEEDTAAHKVKLLNELSAEQRARRAELFRLLTRWISGCQRFTASAS